LSIEIELLIEVEGERWDVAKRKKFRPEQQQLCAHYFLVSIEAKKKESVIGELLRVD